MSSHDYFHSIIFLPKNKPEREIKRILLMFVPFYFSLARNAFFLPIQRFSENKEIHFPLKINLDSKK